jgi:2,3-bisphosphoglycerate-independent phosphoglycerate mutase
VIKAVETVDACVKQVVEKALEKDYAIFLLADHGNADYEINEDGTPNTAHTLNLVPFFVIDNEWKGTVQAGQVGGCGSFYLKNDGLGNTCGHERQRIDKLEHRMVHDDHEIL